MSSFLYDQSSVIIVLCLFVFLVLGVEAGYWFGKRAKTRINKKTQTQINAIQASMLGMLALLMGFTYSQSLQRFDARSEAVVNEADVSCQALCHHG
jgi:hypothetical protein